MSTYSDDIADRMSLESDGIAEALNSLDLASESFGKMDLVSWTLGNYAYDQDKKVYIDADESNRWLSARQARETVRQIVAGFIKEGLQPGDTVCIYAFNDVSARSSLASSQHISDTPSSCIPCCYLEPLELAADSRVAIPHTPLPSLNTT